MGKLESSAFSTLVGEIKLPCFCRQCVKTITEERVTEERVLELNELGIAAVAITNDGILEGKYEGCVCDTKSRLISRHPLLLDTFFRANTLNRFVMNSSQSFHVNYFKGAVEHKH